MLKKVALGLIAALVIFAIVAALQPDEFRVTRSATIKAPAATLFKHVDTKRDWEQWSPWAKLDPNAVFTYEGPDSGVGAITHWKGNSDVGVGTSTIVESRPNEFIQFKLVFEKPIQGENTAEFSFKPEGDSTTVTWTMYGKNNFIGKAVGLVMNCSDMVGEQFENGLANLKSISEAK